MHAILTPLEDRRAGIMKELESITKEPSPWYVGERYFASHLDATLVRARETDRLFRELDRIDLLIDDESAIAYGAAALRHGPREAA